MIVLPAPATLFPLLYHALPLVSGDYNISLGYPLERTPTWGFLNGLAQLVGSMDEERFYIPDYLGLLLHPYTKNIFLDGRTEITRIMIHRVEESLARTVRRFISLEEIEAGRSCSPRGREAPRTEAPVAARRSDSIS